MRRLVSGLLLWFVVGGAALAASPLSPRTLRTLSASDPHALITKVRGALDAGVYLHDPAGERDALWWMGHAGVNVSDGAAVTEAIARLDSLASTGDDQLAESYAGFLSADQRILRGDADGVADALTAAALQLDSHDPAARAMAKFQLCDAYTMASQFRHAQPLCHEADEAFAALHDDWDQAQAKNDEGNDAYGMRQYAAAGVFYRDAQALYQKEGDRSQALMVGDNLAQVYLKEGKPDQALALSRASLADELAAGRESDALNSRYDIARALEAMGKHHAAADLIAATVAAARKARMGAQLPDLLAEQSRLAERNGNLKLALVAEREALAFSRRHWEASLQSQQAELAARYAAREREIRIQNLEHGAQVSRLELRAASADAARNQAVVRRQRTILVAAGVAAAGLGIGIVSLLVLLRSQRRYARDLKRQALEDPLTNIANRRGFFRRVDGLLARHDRDQAPLHALLLFDFDNFKHINDQHGHPFGDIVLNVSIQRLRAVVGPRGHLARLGGEEFVVLCPHAGGDAALRLAEDLREAVGALEFPNAPDGLRVTISVGVALYDGVRCHDAGSWLRCADDAMYMAKAQGRDRTAVASEVGALLHHVATLPRTA